MLASRNSSRRNEGFGTREHTEVPFIVDIFLKYLFHSTISITKIYISVSYISLRELDKQLWMYFLPLLQCAFRYVILKTEYCNAGCCTCK